MSMHFLAKHLDDETLIDCGFRAFGIYRMKLAYETDPLFGFMYQGHYGASFQKDERGDLCAETSIDIDDYVRDNIEIADAAYYDSHPSELAPEVREFEQKISDWAKASGAVSDVRITRSLYGIPGYRILFSLNWTKMCDWCDSHLSKPHDDLFFASDSEGKWSWQECRELYKTFSRYDIEHIYRNAYMRDANMHERMLASWLACWRNRVQLRWC